MQHPLSPPALDVECWSSHPLWTSPCPKCLESSPTSCAPRPLEARHSTEEEQCPSLCACLDEVHGTWGHERTVGQKWEPVVLDSAVLSDAEDHLLSQLPCPCQSLCQAAQTLEQNHSECLTLRTAGSTPEAPSFQCASTHPDSTRHNETCQGCRSHPAFSTQSERRITLNTPSSQRATLLAWHVRSPLVRIDQQRAYQQCKT